MLFKKYYIILFLFLFGIISIKAGNNYGYNRFAKNSQVPNLIIITGEKITLSNDDIFVGLKNGGFIKTEAKNGNIKLQGKKKIVFKPGTKLKAEKGKSYHASIVKEKKEKKPNTLALAANYKFFNKKDNKGNKGFSKESNSGSIVTGNSNIFAVVVDNHNRKIDGKVNSDFHNFQTETKLNTNNNRINGSGFNPETIKVLRL